MWESVEQVCAGKANGPRESVEIAAAQRDHRREVTASRADIADIMDECGHESGIGIFRRRQVREVEASTLEPGAAVVYRARDLLELTLGNAGGVRLRVNGELVPTGGSGDVVSLDLRWQDGEVLTDRDSRPR